MKQRCRRICVGLSLIIALAICVGILIRKETANHPQKYLSNEQYAEQLDVVGIPCTYADFIAQIGETLHVMRQKVWEAGTSMETGCMSAFCMTGLIRSLK